MHHSLHVHLYSHDNREDLGLMLLHETFSLKGAISSVYHEAQMHLGEPVTNLIDPRDFLNFSSKHGRFDRLENLPLVQLKYSELLLKLSLFLLKKLGHRVE